VKALLQAIAIGTCVTLALFGLGFLAAERGAEGLSYALYWQSYVLYKLLPCSIIINPGEFLCENMTVAKVTFFSGIPVGIILYSAVAYVILRARQRRAAPQASRAPDDFR
jgi:hypothetical protein